jgi:hypothetical protein
MRAVEIHGGTSQATSSLAGRQPKRSYGRVVIRLRHFRTFAAEPEPITPIIAVIHDTAPVLPIDNLW